MAAALAARVACGLRGRLRLRVPPAVGSAAFSSGAGGGAEEEDETAWQAALYRTGSMPAAWVHPNLEIAVIKARIGGRRRLQPPGPPPSAVRADMTPSFLVCNLSTRAGQGPRRARNARHHGRRGADGGAAGRHPAQRLRG